MKVTDRFLMDTPNCAFCGTPLEVRKNVTTPWATDECGTTGYEIVGAPIEAIAMEKECLCENCAEAWLETYERQAKDRAKEHRDALAEDLGDDDIELYRQITKTGGVS